MQANVEYALSASHCGSKRLTPGNLAFFYFFQILKKTNNIFELLSVGAPSQLRHMSNGNNGLHVDIEEDAAIKDTNLRLKGKQWLSASLHGTCFEALSRQFAIA